MREGVYTLDHTEHHTISNWRFYLLGGLRVRYTGQWLSVPPYRTHALVAALLLDARPLHRDHLAGQLFPDQPERAGRRRLSDLLWLLRRALPDLALEITAEYIAFPVESRWLDVEVFKRKATTPDPGAWQEALTLYQGPLLPDCFADWLLVEREALHLEYTRLLERASKWLMGRQTFSEALPLAQRLAHEEPFDEEALRMLMRVHAALGQRGAALAAYERFAGLAADELGLEPEQATQFLAQAIRASILTPLRPDTPEPRDLPPEDLLRRAQAALERGDQAIVAAYLERLEAHRPAVDKTAVCLLEMDLALLRNEYTQIERILAMCDRHQAAVLAREAALALGQKQATAACEAASRALLLACAQRDRQSELEALLILTQAQRLSGQPLQALVTAERALRLARERESAAGIVRAHLAQGFALYRQGRSREATPIFYEARALAQEHDLRRYLAEALHGLANVLSDSGNFVETLPIIQETLSIWRDLGLARLEARTLQTLASIYDLLGQHAEALRNIERAMQIYERLGDTFGAACCRYHLAAGMPYRDELLVGESLTLAREALATFHALGQTGWEAATLATLGYALWLDGQHAAALDAFHQSYALHQQRGEMGVLPELLAYQGLAHVGLGDAAAALDCTQRALLALAQGPLDNDIAAEIYYARAMALIAGGQDDEAHDCFVRAYEILLECAAQLQDEVARHAFFRRDPTTRRLMQEVYARGLAPDPRTGVVTRWLPARSDPEQAVPVAWTFDAGPSDVALKRAQGAITLRRSRLARLLEEAQAQGARPTTAQLAQTLNVSPRTIKRDRAALRKA